MSHWFEGLRLRLVRLVHRRAYVRSDIEHARGRNLDVARAYCASRELRSVCRRDDHKLRNPPLKKLLGKFRSFRCRSHSNVFPLIVHCREQNKIQKCKKKKYIYYKSTRMPVVYSHYARSFCSALKSVVTTDKS